MKRKLVLYIAMSMDGYIARKNGDIDWLGGDGSDPNADSGYEKFYSSIDTVIMGRNTYEQILSFGEYPYKGTEGYVYTSKNINDNEDVVFTDEDPDELIRKIRRKGGKDIWLVGGAEIIDKFINRDLIDEYYIAIMPHILGEGIPLFKNNSPELKLKLLSSESNNGIVMIRYKRR